MATLSEALAAVSTRVESAEASIQRLEAEAIPSGSKVTQLAFSRTYLTRAEAGRWLAIILPARRAVEDGTATPEQLDLVLADEHFRLAKAIDFTDPDVQAAIMVMYVKAVFGPVWDDQSGVDPTADEQHAIDRAGQLGRGEPASLPE